MASTRPTAERLPYGVNNTEYMMFVSLLVRNFTTEFRVNFTDQFKRAEASGLVDA